jgi:hypothetical protein
VKERTTFGKPLSKHQVIRHKLAEMATQVNVAREYTYRCAARMQAGESAIAEVSMAKNFATSVSTMVTHEAVQIFGGMGYMRESLVERLYRDNRILSIGGGTHEIMNESWGGSDHLRSVTGWASHAGAGPFFRPGEPVRRGVGRRGSSAQAGGEQARIACHGVRPQSGR